MNYTTIAGLPMFPVSEEAAIIIRPKIPIPTLSTDDSVDSLYLNR